MFGSSSLLVRTRTLVAALTIGACAACAAEPMYDVVLATDA